MTEAEWLESTSLVAMMQFLQDQHRKQGTWSGHVQTWFGSPPIEVSDRKLRLYTIACWRRTLQLIPNDERDWNAIIVAELFTDGEATEPELALAAEAAHAEHFPGLLLGHPWDREELTILRAAAFVLSTIDVIAGDWPPTVSSSGSIAWSEANQKERPHLARILRDILGNPFRRVSVNESLLSWKGGIVRNLAQTIYEDHSFDRLPILADALEDAGCSDTDILAHCRGPGPHVRGCWVVDLLTGRK